MGEEPRIDRNGRADHALSVIPECMPHDWYRARIRGGRTSKWNRLPKHRPLTRADLRRRGVTRAALAKHYLRVEHGIYVPLAAVDMDIAERDTETPGEDLIRAVHPAVLVMAHALRHPQQVATSFAAGALLGMRYFASEEPLEFLTPRGVRQDNQPGHIVSTQTRRISAYRQSAVTRGTSDPVLRQVRMTPLGDTLAYMLRTLQTPDEARDRRWRVPDLTGVRCYLTPEFIRCVQTSDAFHQALGKETPGNLTALRVPGTVSVDAAAAVLEATDVGAESPPETLPSAWWWPGAEGDGGRSAVTGLSAGSP